MKNLYAAMAQARANFAPLKQSGHANTGKFGYNYSTLDDIEQAIGQAIAEAGLIMYQWPGQDDGLYVECTIAHVESGESITARCPLILSGENMQQLGSAISYARRYLPLAMWNLSMGGEDDDGQAAMPRKPAPRAPQRQAPPTVEEDIPFSAPGITPGLSEPQQRLLDTMRQTHADSSDVATERQYGYLVRLVDGITEGEHANVLTYIVGRPVHHENPPGKELASKLIGALKQGSDDYNPQVVEFIRTLAPIAKEQFK